MERTPARTRLLIATATLVAVVAVLPTGEARADTTIINVGGTVAVVGGPETNVYRIWDSMLPIEYQATMGSQFSQIGITTAAVTAATAAWPGVAVPWLGEVMLGATIVLATYQAWRATGDQSIPKEQVRGQGGVLIQDFSMTPGIAAGCRRDPRLDSAPGPPKGLPANVQLRLPPVTYFCPALGIRGSNGEAYTNVVVETLGGDDYALSFRKPNRWVDNRSFNLGSGDDRGYGGDGRERFWGGFGNDFIRAGAGNDLIFGNNPGVFEPVPDGIDDDRLFGQEGNDIVLGQGGNDVIDGGFDSDKALPHLETWEQKTPGISAFVSDAALQGGHGQDTVVGGEGEDTLDGGPGRDFLHSREGDFNSPEEPDPIVDCGRAKFGPTSNEIYRDSPGIGVDQVSNCEIFSSTRLDLASLLRWDPGTPFPWIAGL